MNDPSNGYPGDPGEYPTYDDFELDNTRWSKPNRSTRDRKRKSIKRERKNGDSNRKKERVEARDGTFRCRHCKTMVGLPISGGKHRNHCPLCLYSRHVDARRPGDRSSTCLSLMQPIGLYSRRSGEQVLVHQCLGCEIVRHNRVAADDNVVATMRLPILSADPAIPAPGSEERPAS